MTNLSNKFLSLEIWTMPMNFARKQYRTRARRAAVSGYSLLEILIVLAIIAMIVALVGPRLFAQLDKSKVTTARVQMQGLKAALSTMRLDIDRYPTKEEGLGLLQVSPNQSVPGWSGPYMDGAVPKDPWGSAYIYAPPATTAELPSLTSLGADSKPGGTGIDADLTL